MKCDNCEACQNTSYEYQEYECVLGIDEEEFKDGTYGCRLHKSTISKEIEKLGNAMAEQYAGLADFMEESEKKDEALQKAIETVLSEWCLCRKNIDGSLHEVDFHRIISSQAWDIRSKYEENLEKQEQGLVQILP